MKFIQTETTFINNIVWTLNLKSFEIGYTNDMIITDITMNFKLEKFWNLSIGTSTLPAVDMNFKLEKFWNIYFSNSPAFPETMNFKLEKFWNFQKYGMELKKLKWTLNLKSFEIFLQQV